MMHEPIKRDPLQMALDEAIRHSASEIYLDHLRRYFREIVENKSAPTLSAMTTLVVMSAKFRTEKDSILQHANTYKSAS